MDNSITFEKIKPTKKDLIDFRTITNSNKICLTPIERIKTRLGLSSFAFFVSRFALNKFYIIREGDRMIGFSIFRINFIRALFIMGHKKNNGLGSLLLNYILEDNRSKTIYVKPVVRARGFYLKNKFVVISEDFMKWMKN